jgi:hypothetical protein
MDNFQIHNRALTEGEIRLASEGEIVYNDNLVLAYDFDEEEEEIFDLT